MDKLYVAVVNFTSGGKDYHYVIPPRLINTDIANKVGYICYNSQLKVVTITDTKTITPSK